MGVVTVEINPQGISYPRGKTVYRGDTVEFQVVDLPFNVTVTFGSPCCFTSSTPLTLNSNSAMTESAPETVASNAAAGTYHFTVTIPDPQTLPSNDQRRKRPHDWESKEGDLEVSTDPGGDY